MKKLFLALIIATIVFMIYKSVIVLVGKAFDRIFKPSVSGKWKFDISLAIALQVLFISIWTMSVDSVMKRFGLSNLEAYLAFCLIGIYCVLWCYFSWDAQRIFSKPRLATKAEKKVKKVIMYLLILVFSLCQGYHQTLHAIDTTYVVDAAFSVTNYSIVVSAIAVDRIMNQLCNEEKRIQKK